MSIFYLIIIIFFLHYINAKNIIYCQALNFGVCDTVVEIKSSNTYNISTNNIKHSHNNCSSVGQALELYSRKKSFIITQIGIRSLMNMYRCNKNITVQTEYNLFTITNDNYIKLTKREWYLEKKFFQNTFKFFNINFVINQTLVHQKVTEKKNLTPKIINFVKTFTFLQIINDTNKTNSFVEKNNEKNQSRKRIHNYLLILSLELVLIIMSL